ncbi:MAG: GNAT family N-acetyltransferase [Psychrobacter sp.]|nr:GNAT family N-acetyltransferase [Psychrobacter sp.]
MTDYVIEQLIESRVARASLLLRQVYTDQQLYQQFTQELAEDIERLTRDDLAELFYQLVPVTGVSAQDYKTRMVFLELVGHILCGIRFRGMDITRPFVNIELIDAPLNPATLAAISRHVRQDFKAFGPHYIQCYIPSHMHIGPTDFIEEYPAKAYSIKAHWDYRILAAPLSALIEGFLKEETLNKGRFNEEALKMDTDIDNQLVEVDLIKNNGSDSNLNFVNATAAETPPNSNDKTVKLIPATSLTFYPDYEQGYKTMVAQLPQQKEWTEMMSAYEMQQGVNNGLVYLLKVGGKLAGLMALERSNSLGMSGYYVNENIVFNRYRGLGLGKWLQQSVIERLAERSDWQRTDMLFGTIHHDNQSAIQCAKSIGREDIGGYLWVSTAL